jgi:hypothetical protein
MTTITHKASKARPSPASRDLSSKAGFVSIRAIRVNPPLCVHRVSAVQIHCWRLRFLRLLLCIRKSQLLQLLAINCNLLRLFAPDCDYFPIFPPSSPYFPHKFFFSRSCNFLPSGPCPSPYALCPFGRPSPSRPLALCPMHLFESVFIRVHPWSKNLCAFAALRLCVKALSQSATTNR